MNSISKLDNVITFTAAGAQLEGCRAGKFYGTRITATPSSSTATLQVKQLIVRNSVSRPSFFCFKVLSQGVYLTLSHSHFGRVISTTFKFSQHDS